MKQTQPNRLANKLMDEIRETNLSYLLLAQQMLREDRADALFRLGITESIANMIEQLTTAQILKIASTNLLMCRFRFDDELVWELLTSHSQDRQNQVSGIHASILMATQSDELSTL
jgi:flagellar transcriptional activator FlhD